jgi:hypothetical protein
MQGWPLGPPVGHALLLHASVRSGHGGATTARCGKGRPEGDCRVGDEADAASSARDASALDQIWVRAQTVGADVVVASAASVPTHWLDTDWSAGIAAYRLGELLREADGRRHGGGRQSGRSSNQPGQVQERLSRPAARHEQSHRQSELAVR